MKYSRFENYGLELRFGDEVMSMADEMVPDAPFADTICQTLRLPPEKLLERVRKDYEPRFSVGV